MTDVFISYSRRDQQFVRQLHKRLEEAGRESWVDWECIPLTADWLQEIEAGIEAADTFVFIISPDSVRSEVCAAEVEHAIGINKRLVPILHRELESDYDKAALHPSISSHNWTFMRDTDDFDQSFDLLIDALDTDLSHVRMHTRVLTRAIEWDDKNRDASFLLRGSDLQDAEEWVNAPGIESKEPKVTVLHTEYIQSSRQAENWRRRERLLMGLITVALIVALSAAVIAFWQFQEAEQQRFIAEQQRATAQRLAQAANSRVALGNNNTDLAIALALVAADGEPRAEIERALADAVYSPGTRLSFDQHQGEIRTIAFHPNGEWALSAACATTEENVCVEGEMLLWDVHTGELIRRFDSRHPDEILDIEFSPDGDLAISVGCGERESGSCIAGLVVLWDVETGTVIREFAGHTGVVEVAAFSPVPNREDHMTILTGSTDRTMRLWEVDTGRELHVFDQHQGKVVGIAFNPNGRDAISIAINTAPILWDLGRGEPIARFENHKVTDEPNLTVGSVTYSPDGRTILSSYGITMRLWDARSGELIRSYSGHGSFINSLAMSADGRYAFSSAWRENSIRMWDVDAGVEIRRFEGHMDVVNQVALNTANALIVTASDDGTARVWDIRNGSEIDTLHGHTDDLFTLAIDPNNNYIASAGDDDVIRIWDFETHEELWQFSGHDADVWSIAFSPDGRYLLSGGEDNRMRLWDMETRKQIAVYQGHKEWVTSVAFSHDGAFVASGSNDNTVCLWETLTAEQVRCYGDQGSELRSVAFSPDDQKILAGAGTVARMFEVSGEGDVQIFDVAAGRVNAVAFLDNNTIATGSGDGTVRLWDVETGEELRIFSGHSGQVRSVMFSPDGKRILSASADTTLRLWDIESGLEIRRFEGHTEWVNQAVFTADGKWAISGAWDDTLKTWHIHDLESLITWAQDNRYIRSLTCAEERIYLLVPGESCQVD